MRRWPSSPPSARSSGRSSTDRQFRYIYTATPRLGTASPLYAMGDRAGSAGVNQMVQFDPLSAAFFGICILLAAFFSSAEVALISISRARVRTLVNDHRQGASALSELRADPDRILITTLIGTTLVCVAAAALATEVALAEFGPSGVPLAIRRDGYRPARGRPDRSHARRGPLSRQRGAPRCRPGPRPLADRLARCPRAEPTLAHDRERRRRTANRP